MSQATLAIPFVDLTLQHQPIQAQIEQEIRQVIERGDFVLGKAVAEFEASFAAACGVTYGVGVASGTDAIALSLRAAGITAGDEVILPTHTFIATLIGVLRSGAKPVLVDCDPETALMDLQAVATAITDRTRAIIPVHLYGQLVPPQPLLELASSHQLMIIEDAAQAHLAEREGIRAGAIGDLAAFSFYPSKNLGALGDGGMVVTSNGALAEKLRSLRNYGSPQKYLHVDQGTNSRLDTLQAAVLQVKLPHLQGWNQARNQLAQQYDALLQPLGEKGIVPVSNQSGVGHIYHLYVIRVTSRCVLDRNQLQQALAAQGIQTGIHYPIPCHLQPGYQFLGYRQGEFPVAETLCQEILSLPMYPGMLPEQVEQVVSQIQTAIVGG